MLHIGAFGVQGRDIGRVDVEAGDRKALGREGAGKRQPDIAQPDDTDAGGAGLDARKEC